MPCYCYQSLISISHIFITICPGPQRSHKLQYLPYYIAISFKIKSSIGQFVLQDGQCQDEERQPLRRGDHLHTPGVLLPLHTVAERDIQALLHLLPPLLLWRQRVLPLPGLGGRPQL